MDSNSKMRVLKKFTVELTRDMNPDHMKLSLFAKQLLTTDEMERINLPTMTTRDKNMFILMKLPSKGRQAFDLFMDCLKETSEENRSHSELVSQIMLEVNNGTEH